MIFPVSKRLHCLLTVFLTIYPFIIFMNIAKRSTCTIAQIFTRDQNNNIYCIHVFLYCIADWVDISYIIVANKYPNYTEKKKLKLNFQKVWLIDCYNYKLGPKFVRIFTFLLVDRQNSYKHLFHNLFKKIYYFEYFSIFRSYFNILYIFRVCLGFRKLTTPQIENHKITVQDL